MSDAPISERELTTYVGDLAKLHRWRRYHTWTSIHSPSGFPDEVLVRGPRLIFAELKSERGKLSAEQEAWLEALRVVARGRPGEPWRVVPVEQFVAEEDYGVEVYVWRPSDMEAIAEVLR